MPEIDWVTARFECSLPKVFETLRLEIQKDVEKWNRLHPAENGRKCVVAGTEDSFTVRSNPPPPAFGGSRDSRKVNFHLYENSILVTNKSEEKILEATLTLNDVGECRLKIDNQEFELWQLRRKVLEDLFFTP